MVASKVATTVGSLDGFSAGKLDYSKAGHLESRRVVLMVCSSAALSVERWVSALAARTADSMVGLSAASSVWTRVSLMADKRDDPTVVPTVVQTVDLSVGLTVLTKVGTRVDYLADSLVLQTDESTVAT